MSSGRSTPAVSIVLPFFHADAFFSEAIESVLAQTFHDWELLLVDDGSTEADRETALRYVALHHGCLRYLTHDGRQNRGASASRNLGQREARGRYLAYLDADDAWLPRKLEMQVEILERRPDVGMTYGPGLWWWSWSGLPEDIARDRLQPLGDAGGKVMAPPEMLVRFLRDEGAVPSPSGVLVRKCAADRAGGFEASFRSVFDDQVFYAKLALSERVAVSTDCCYRYRQHAGSRCQIAVDSGQHDAAKTEYLIWLEEFLASKGESSAAVRAAFRHASWPYRHPFLNRLNRTIRQCVPAPVRLMIRKLRSIDSAGNVSMAGHS
jgi:hypothetical protein